MKRKIAQLPKHYVISGNGRVVRNAARELRNEKCPFVIVDNNAEFVEAARAIGVKRGELLLLYTTVDPEFDDVVMSGQAVVEARAEAERSGRNLASQALLLLSQPEVIDRARRAPHPRVRALLDVLIDAEGFVDDDGWRFTLPDDTTPRLDEITLPTTAISGPRSSIGTTTTDEQPAPETLDNDATPAVPQRWRGLLGAVRRGLVGPER